MNDISANPVLSEEQKSLLLGLGNSSLRDHFYLTGGTALAAFHLQHRVSEDLDLFTEEPVGIEEILAFLRSLPAFGKIEYHHKFDRRIFVLQCSTTKILNVEFTLYPFPRCDVGLSVEGVYIDSLTDILANKLVAMTDRRDAKDYVDLYFALKSNPDLDIEMLIRDAERKFGVVGVKDILRGRFLEGPPPLGILKMRETLDATAMAEFFSVQARDWISSSVKGKP